MRKVGFGLGMYIVGVGVGVFLGIITYQLVKNFTASMSPAPTGTDALIINNIPTFLAISVMMLPVMAIYVAGRAGTGV